MKPPDTVSAEDLQCLRATQEHLRMAQGVVQFQVAYLRSKYKIGPQDTLHMDSGIILRHEDPTTGHIPEGH